MFVRVEVLNAGEAARELLGVVDEDGQVLGADVKFGTLVGEGQQGDFGAGALAGNTGRLGSGFGIRHGILLKQSGYILSHYLYCAYWEIMASSSCMTAGIWSVEMVG